MRACRGSQLHELPAGYQDDIRRGLEELHGGKLEAPLPWSVIVPINTKLKQSPLQLTNSCYLIRVARDLRWPDTIHALLACPSTEVQVRIVFEEEEW